MPAFRPFCILALCAAGFASSANANLAAQAPAAVVAAAPELRGEAASFTFADPAVAAAEVPESFQSASAGKERAAPTPLVVSAVPEPTSYALMLAGLVALHWVARRRINRPD